MHSMAFYNDILVCFETIYSGNFKKITKAFVRKLRECLPVMEQVERSISTDGS